MNNKLICPICQQELEIWHTNKVRMYACPDLTCKGYYMSATKDMWQELIRIRKALEIAIDAMKISNEIVYSAYGSPLKTLKDALEQIKTALEQKE